MSNEWREWHQSGLDQDSRGLEPTTCVCEWGVDEITGTSSSLIPNLKCSNSTVGTVFWLTANTTSPNTMPGEEVARVVTRCNQAKEDHNLDLSGCCLTQIPEAVFLLMKHTVLQSCNLSENLIPRIPSKLPVRFSSLTVLNLSRNHLTTLPDELKNMEALEKLDVSHNHFTTLPAVVYSLRNLKQLSAENNHIQDVDVQQLKSLSSLTVLNFRDNPLTFETYTQFVTVSEVLTIYVTPQDPTFDSVD